MPKPKPNPKIGRPRLPETRGNICIRLTDAEREIAAALDPTGEGKVSAGVRWALREAWGRRSDAKHPHPTPPDATPSDSRPRGALSDPTA